MLPIQHRPVDRVAHSLLSEITGGGSEIHYAPMPPANNLKLVGIGRAHTVLATTDLEGRLLMETPSEIVQRIAN